MKKAGDEPAAVAVVRSVNYGDLHSLFDEVAGITQPARKAVLAARAMPNVPYRVVRIKKI